MRSKAFKLAPLIAVSSLTLALNAFGSTDSHLPEVHHQGSATYLMGGVGELEADAIKHAAGNYPLELEFLMKATPKDEYLSGVQVRIKDSHDQTVLNIVTDGPFMLARLPAGNYTVSAEHNGKVDRREIKISDNEHRRVVFEWQA